MAPVASSSRRKASSMGRMVKEAPRSWAICAAAPFVASLEKRVGM
jgi:hypothetical protein